VCVGRRSLGSSAGRPDTAVPKSDGPVRLPSVSAPSASAKPDFVTRLASRLYPGTIDTRQSKKEYVSFVTGPRKPDAALATSPQTRTQSPSLPQVTSSPVSLSPSRETTPRFDGDGNLLEVDDIHSPTDSEPVWVTIADAVCGF
jgi:hypothetical protein